MCNKRGQVTLFVIIAIIVAGIVGVVFLTQTGIISPKIPETIQPIYNTFLSCLEEKTKTGIDTLESQAGYIYLPEYEQGSSYIPFSSQLSLSGNDIPYWYYVSSANTGKEQIPSKSDMEEQLGEFIDGKIRNCYYNEYYSQGFQIQQEEPKTRITIKDNEVIINLDMKLTITGEDSFYSRNHNAIIKSNLGNLYNSAIKIYEAEKKDLFLEDYALDNLRTYAPVDGIEFSCSSKIWNADEVFNTLQEAIQANTLALRTQKNGYFNVEVPVNNEVRFINSRDWPTTLEVTPSESNILSAEPIGNQPGLGALGFCFIPYHFVYNLKYPVLVQVYNKEEFFQFPLAVVIEGNKAREAADVEAANQQAISLCEYKNVKTTITTKDSSLNNLNADIYYECLGEKCYLGKTESETLETELPQCVNGILTAKTDGFQDSRTIYSSAREGNVEIFLNKIYKKNVELKADGKEVEEATIIFNSPTNPKTIFYPQQKEVELSEGDYSIQVQIYKDSSLTFGPGVKEQCMQFSEGIGASLGITQEKCFELKIPQQIVSKVLAGGGKADYSVDESQLKNSNTIQITVQSLPVPNSLQEIENNYLSIEDKTLNIEFR